MVVKAKRIKLKKKVICIKKVKVNINRRVEIKIIEIAIQGIINLKKKKIFIKKASLNVIITSKKTVTLLTINLRYEKNQAS